MKNDFKMEAGHLIMKLLQHTKSGRFASFHSDKPIDG
jgi:hypothetical protein